MSILNEALNQRRRTKENERYLKRVGAVSKAAAAALEAGKAHVGLPEAEIRALIVADAAYYGLRGQGPYIGGSFWHPNMTRLVVQL